MNSTCVIEPNPDVSGTGTRVSIYIMAISRPILTLLIDRIGSPNDSFELSRSISSAMSIQGLALLCTAVYQLSQSKLTLFHAIVVIHLLALLGVSVVNKGNYENFGRYRVAAAIFVQIVALCVFASFNWKVWRAADVFGSQVECNSSTVYVIFGVTIDATSKVFRYLILATFITICIGFILSLLFALPIMVFGIIHYRRHRDEYYESPAQPSVVASESVETRKFVSAVGHTVFCIYAVVSLEQTIQWNNLSAEEKQWTFGQIIALFLLLGTANELLSTLLSVFEGRRQKKNQTAQSVELLPRSVGSSQRYLEDT